jgi:hypothetical protein
MTGSELLGVVEDTPRWIETRAMLLSGRATVTGGRNLADGFVVRAQYDAVSAVAVGGRPPSAAILAALDDLTPQTPLIVQKDNAAWVADCLRSGAAGPWQPERVILHRLAGEPSAAAPAGVAARLLGADELLDHLPAPLRHEMTHARRMGPVSAVFVDDRPVSFCYPCWRTESLWDVSIDTLEAYRGRSLAVAAVHHMIDEMGREGREPVWGAVASNSASLRLAAKLGFAPVDEIVVFSRGHWALLTGGFEA